MIVLVVKVMVFIVVSIIFALTFEQMRKQIIKNSDNYKKLTAEAKSVKKTEINDKETDKE